MQKYFDWPTFIKLDNASTIDYLTSLASGLIENKLISDAAILDLQVTLSSQPPKWAASGKSAISSLLTEKSEFLNIVKLRYGTTGAALNHLRFSVRPLLTELMGQCANWSLESLKKGEIVLNRPFFVRSGETIVRRELYPMVLLALSTKLEYSAKAIHDVIQDLSYMRPTDLLDVTGEFLDIETSIATGIGFVGVDPLRTFNWTERTALRRVSLLLVDLSESICELFGQIEHNTSRHEDMVTVTALTELLSLEAQRFCGLTLPDTTSEMVWETRRQAVAFGLFSMIQITSDLATASLNAIAAREHQAADLSHSLDVERRLAASLLQIGVTAARASEASHALVSYCKRHEICPTNIIEPELKKIHADLRPEVLTLYQSLVKNSLTATPGGATAKNRVRERSLSIRSGLQGLVTTIALSIMSIGLGSCGVKTTPKSAIEPIRPSIPFRELPQPVATPNQFKKEGRKL